MLEALMIVPQNEIDWQAWSFHHKDSHDRIHSAIQNAVSVNYPILQLDPINFNDFKIFLDNNQSMHNDFNTQLKLGGSDLSELKLEDKEALKGWIEGHYEEHRDAEQALKI